jgi:hypothetical protein
LFYSRRAQPANRIGTENRFERRERDLFNGVGDLGADTVAGEESGSDGRGIGGEGPGYKRCEGVRVCGGGENLARAASEGASKELGSHDH